MAVLSSELSPAARAAKLAAVRQTLLRNPGWEPWEYGELLSSAECAHGVSLTDAERAALRYS